MDATHLQEILSAVERPSRYLGTETNARRKSMSQVRLRMALAFPDLYEIGTSHFGMQILYHLLNQREEIYAERVFAPGPDLDSILRSTHTRLWSLETRTPLDRFDIIGFSLLYELNYTNILNMLELSNIPFYAEQRGLADPILIAGGPCTSNPEPIAAFFDAMVVGDGESAMMTMADKWLEWFASPPLDKERLLHEWAAVDGVYIPALFDAQFHQAGAQSSVPKPSAPSSRIKRAVEPDLNAAPFPEAPIVPFGKPVHDRLRLEIARGCTRGCRFCQAGMIYRPVRERSVANLCRIAEKSIGDTGYDDLSLLSLSTGDYSQIDDLVALLMNRCEGRRTAISLPSLRADSVGPELMQAIKKIRKTGFTFAPEAGSQRLRRVINKNLPEEEIIRTVTEAFSQGWRLVKLYFMIGLPTETMADVEAIVALVQQLRQIRRKNGAYGQLNVSVATFIPKPHTPFQWLPQLTLGESKERIDYVRQRLRLAGIRFKYQPPEVSLIEGLWARGDRRLAPLLIKAHRSGCRFDGWSDHFRFDTWQRICSETGTDIESYTSRNRDADEPLPWDHIDIGVSKEYLQRELKRAMAGKVTPDCRHGDCQACGVCDFDRIAPVLSPPHRADTPQADRQHKPPATDGQKITLTYTKMDEARHFGHLEMANLFQRAMHRARIPVKYSEGFHPKPRLSFGNPLPVGVESEAEFLTITVTHPVNESEMRHRLNRYLPNGLRVISSQQGSRKETARSDAPDAFVIETKGGGLDSERIRWFDAKNDLIIQRKNKNGRLRDIDLKKAVNRMELNGDNTLYLELISPPSGHVRPVDILRHVFQLNEDRWHRLRILKKARAAPAALRETGVELNRFS